MDWRGRLETRAAFWTLIAGVAVFAASAVATPLLAGYGLVRLVRWTGDHDAWLAPWGVSAALLMFRAAWTSIEALGQLWWRRLGEPLACWSVVVATWPGWWMR